MQAAITRSLTWSCEICRGSKRAERTLHESQMHTVGQPVLSVQIDAGVLSQSSAFFYQHI